jgi:hypothetical protein
MKKTTNENPPDALAAYDTYDRHWEQLLNAVENAAFEPAGLPPDFVDSDWDGHS